MRHSFVGHPRVGGRIEDVSEKKRELMLKAAFLRATTLTVKDFVPATGIGKFDLKYDPTQHRIDITVNLAYRFARDLQKPEQLAWDTAAELKFKQDAKPLIEQGWSGLYTLTCARPGWHDVFGDVYVTVNEVASDQAAYIVEVTRLGRYKSSGGIKHGVTPHVCHVNNFANDLDTSKNQEQLFSYKEGLIATTCATPAWAGRVIICPSRPARRT